MPMITCKKLNRFKVEARYSRVMAARQAAADMKGDTAEVSEDCLMFRSWAGR